MVVSLLFRGCIKKYMNNTLTSSRFFMQTCDNKKNCEEKKKSKSKKNTNLEGYKKHSIILYKKYNCILKNHVFNIFYSYLFSWDLIKKKQ
jgi:hypothetical protein